MRKYKNSFYTMLISVLLVVVLYILKNIGSIYQWNIELRILFYTCLIGINLIVLCLTFASKNDMDEILQYNPQGKAEKSKNRRFVKWYRDTVKNEKQKWKFVLIVVITAVAEVLLLFLNRIMKIDIVSICDLILDIITIAGIGSAFVQIHINYTINQHLDDNKQNRNSD